MLHAVRQSVCASDFIQNSKAVEMYNLVKSMTRTRVTVRANLRSK